MTAISASEAKTHFGALIDKAQQAPVTIERQGRPVAVVLSYDAYLEHYDSQPSLEEKEQALSFLNTWSAKPSASDVEKSLGEDTRAQAIWQKYNQEA